MKHIERFAGVIAAVFLGLAMALALDRFMTEEPLCRPTTTTPTC